MEKRGEITIFLSMILLCVSGMLCVMLESARTAGARWYLQVAANSSIDSLFSQYHRQLWQEYHLLGLEYESEQEMTERLRGFLEPYLEADNWYPLALEEIEIKDLERLTDESGLWLEQEILAYMKYGVWDRLDIRPEEGARLWTDMREAVGMTKAVSSYEKQSDAAWELEKTLDKIYQSLGKQKEYRQDGADCLSGKRSSGFQRAADKLVKEIGKIPGLLRIYEKQADRMAGEISRLEREYEAQSGDLSGEMKTGLKQELEQYRAYVQEDGSRREEIMGLETQGEINLAVIGDVKNRVDEIDSYLSSLGDEEEDYSAGMWDAAESRWGRIRGGELKEPGEKQEEKRGWLMQIRKMADGGLLELVIPPGREISTEAFAIKGLPSAGKGGSETDRKNLLNRVLVNEYCAMHFTDFLGVDTAAEDSGESGQNYGMEYLLGGMGSDRENLAEAVKQILLVREGLNLIHLFSDNQKRQEARVLALGITGALGLTPLVEITAFFILSVWALGEAVVDVRTLLAGGKVPLLKRSEEWNLGLTQLLEMGKNGMDTDQEDAGSGLSYSGYLKLLLLLEESERKYYRMMDVMQMNLQRTQGDFQISFCAYRVDMGVKVCGKHVFFALPFVEKLTGSTKHVYPLNAVTQKAY